MTSNCGTDDVSFNLDMQERFQWLKQNERTRYMCPDYTNPLQYTSSTDGDWQERLQCLQGILDDRNKMITWLHNCANELGIPSRVMSTAVYIFDRYLSTFVPAYVKRELAFPPHHTEVIALASLFIAVKSMLVNLIKVNDMPYSPIGDIIYNFSHSQYKSLTGQVSSEHAETTILMALDWNIVYVPPNAIVEDLLSVLPRPCEYDEGHDDAFSTFVYSIYQEARKLTRKSELIGDFIKYPPSTIALAALSIALEDYTDVTGVPIFILVPPLEYVNHEINKRGIDLSFDDEDVLRCRKDMMQHFFPTKAINKDTSERVTGTDSPTTVAEVHKRRRTTKKRNSFAAKSA